MTHPVHINLVDLLTGQFEENKREIFTDDYFKRIFVSSLINQEINVELLIDYIYPLEIRHYHVSLIPLKTVDICFTLRNTDNFFANSNGLLSTYGGNQKKVLWLPKQPVIRIYDANGRIKVEKGLQFGYEQIHNDIHIKIPATETGRTEFPVILFNKDGEAFLEELNISSSIECEEFIKCSWFRYKNVSDVWNYFINGNIYDPRHETINRRWQCQQCAHTLYYHLNFLGDQTKKRIYKALRDIIAYSVMISLPLDGRWRHGHWTHEMETHARFQVDGIHLLLMHYEETRREVFLEKAKLAMNYLISIAEELPDGSVWFLHDSLETNERQMRLFHKKNIQSRAFGKSISNTFCLNTHLWTLTALHRLSTLDPDQKYKTYLEKGLKSVENALKAEPMHMLYSVTYGVRDLVLKARSQKDCLVTQRLQHVIDRIIRRFVLPYMKKNFPRLAMPNGFIERDLSYSMLSDYYHLQNLLDLLMLYTQVEKEWILDFINKGIKCALETDLAKHLAEEDVCASIFTETLLLYYSVNADTDIKPLVEFVAYLRARGIPLSVDAFSCPLVSTSYTSVIAQIDLL